MKKDIIKILDEMLMKEIKKNKTKTNYYLREKVLQHAKEDNLIKDYYFTRERKNGCIYFGSCVGFDSMFKIIL